MIQLQMFQSLNHISRQMGIPTIQIKSKLL